MVWRRGWDPFEEMKRMMEKLMDDSWFEFRIGPISSREFRTERFREPLADVFETDKEVVITVELPGVRKEDIDVTVREDSVEIRAEVKSEFKEEREGIIRAERSYQGFYRVIPLPTEVVADKAKATYNNGVLEIRVPKAKPESKGKKVKVE